jgi:DNA-binding transcriptional LysR family regulator
MNRSLLLDLPVFLAVARHGSMTKAATFLHTVQSNVTSRIHRLEEELGVTLFARNSRSLRITADGEALLPVAVRLEELDRDLRRRLERSEAPDAGSLRIGSIETFAASQLPALIAGFTSTHPQVEISVQAGGTDVLRRKVLKSDLDVAFVSRASNDPNLYEKQVLSDELVVLAPGNIASFKDLARTSNSRLRVLVQRADCSFTAWLAEHLRALGLPNRPTHAVGTLEGVIGSVRAGSGIAALPRSYVTASAGIESLSLLRMPPPLRGLEIFLVVQKWKHPIRLVDTFIESCLASAPNQRPARAQPRRDVPRC